MNRLTILACACLGASLLSTPLTGSAAETNKTFKFKPYPLKTCAVSGEKLDSMGKPFPYTYGDRELKFCCKNCVKDFKKDPQKYIKKLEEAEKQPR